MRAAAKLATTAALAWACRGGGEDCAVTDTCPNRPPSATISAPANGASVIEGTEVVFQGSATDLEDGDLTGGSLTWTSSIDGQIGTGASFSRSDLSAGAHTITLTARDAVGAPGTASIALTMQPGFDIILRTSPGVILTPAQAAALASAETRWEAIITADLADISFSMSSEFDCGGATVPPFNETVDDLIIHIEFESIDGPGGVVGEAGPCVVRDFAPQGSLQPGDLPFLGGMRFDNADLNQLQSAGLLDEVILHEMGHVLGFGLLWRPMGFLQDPSVPESVPEPCTDPPSQPDTHFDGTQAVAAMLGLETASGTSYTGGARVPAENDVCEFTVGSLDGHWRESVFTSELMTPSLSAGANPLSRLTLESLADLGYAVDPNQADPYSPVFAVLAGGAAAPGIELHSDVAQGAIWGVTPDGDVRQIR